MLAIRMKLKPNSTRTLITSKSIYTVVFTAMSLYSTFIKFCNTKNNLLKEFFHKTAVFLMQHTSIPDFLK
jgi:hypothetical protein